MFIATQAAGGPWTAAHCHGGAPAALLASAIEEVPTLAPMHVARLTVDLMRAVPLNEPLRIEVHEQHQGKRMQLVSADLLLGDSTLARATGLKVRTTATAPLETLHDDPPADRHRPMPGGFSDQFTIVPDTGAAAGPQAESRWFRLNSPLVEGRKNSPLARCIAAADFGSGISNTLAFEDWQFPSLDLSVGIAREPAGPWILLQSRWLTATGGRTTCVTLLSDIHGLFGEGMQTVLLEPRPGHQRLSG